MLSRSVPACLAFGFGLLLASASSAAVSEVEGNNVLAAANALTPVGGGLLVEGALQPGDVDFYSFSVSAGDFVTLAVVDSGRGSHADPALRVFDASNAVVATDDDSGPGFLPSLRLIVPSGGGGTWKVAVTGFGDADFDGSGHSEDFDYELVIGAEPPAFAEPSPDNNDTPALADSLGSGTFETIAPGSVAVIEGALEAGGIDHFSFPVEAGRQLSVAIYEEGAGAFNDPVVSLLGPAATPIASDDDSGPNFLSALFGDPSANATWTVKVGPFDGDQDAYPYRLVLALGPANATNVLVCDANGDDFIDRNDINLIFAARGQSVPAGDPRDANADGLVTVQDSRLCTAECGNAQCAPPPPPPLAGCGLLGIEPFALLALVGGVRRCARALRRNSQEDPS
jgi:hypothetical protein